jgi:transposase
MDHFAGLDVSVKETSICIVDDTGRIVREVKAASEPQALLKVLGNPTYRFKRIGLMSDIAPCPFRATNGLMRRSICPL